MMAATAVAVIKESAVYFFFNMLVVPLGSLARLAPDTESFCQQHACRPGREGTGSFESPLGGAIRAGESAFPRVRSSLRRLCDDCTWDGSLRKKRILAQSPMAVARTPEPLGKLNPRVAAGQRHRRIAAIRKLTAFLREYRDALERYLGYLRTDIKRAREVIFPAGTYLMRVRHAVECQAPP